MIREASSESDHAQINEKISHRSDQIFREKTSHRVNTIEFDNHRFYVDVRNHSKCVIFFIKCCTSSIESDLSISLIRSALKKHFELRYRLNFLDLLNLLIISCMKNVIDLNQVLKFRSYKKIMKDFK